MNAPSSPNVIVLGRLPLAPKGAVVASRSLTCAGNRPRLGIIVGLNGFRTPGDGMRGYHVLYEDGQYHFLTEDRFSMEVIRIPGIRLPELSAYQFHGVLRLTQQFNLGHFQSAFHKAAKHVDNYVLMV